MLTAEEVAVHNGRGSCWVVISGQVYDVTDFLDEHPGGASTILRYAGKDATEEYVMVHPPGTLERNLPQEKHLGAVDASTLQPGPSKQDTTTQPTTSNRTIAERLLSTENIPLHLCQNLDGFEEAARQRISERAWVYFHSAADSLNSVKTNRNDWEKISFRPRILRDVAEINMSCSIMGVQSDLPFFIAPAAQARLAHPDGELCLARGAALMNIPYCVSTYASVSLEEIVACMSPDGKGAQHIFQLYVPVQKEKTRELNNHAKALQFAALVLTVDTAVVGKREEDERYKARLEWESGTVVPRQAQATPQAGKPILRGAHSSTLNWSDLKWIRELWGTAPFYLKGIQSFEDAQMALEAGVNGIILSNHGGRQLDFSPSSIRTLLEIRKFCPQVLDKLEVYLDGGIRRGSDVIKALCLGATAVGLGRPFMYALGAYGTEGVVRAIELLGEEIQTTMRLMGVTSLEQLDETYVNTILLERELPPTTPKRVRTLRSSL